VNTSLTKVCLKDNEIGAEGAAALADALKENSAVTKINLNVSQICDEGAAALAEALKLNTSVTYIDLDNNTIGDEGAAALADLLKVNTSLTAIFLDGNAVDEKLRARVCALANERNVRFRRLLLFDARQMLLSRLRGSGDECGVVWLYFIESSANDVDDGAVPDDIDSIRIELAAVVTERRRREMSRPALVSDINFLTIKMTNKIADQTNMIVELSVQSAEQTSQIAEQTSQITDLQRSTQTLIEQNQQIQEQMRQMHALLMSREGAQTADVDKRDKRAVKRRRTGR
jgi:DNA repair exonuclease SbcCD ATPase subunit